MNIITYYTFFGNIVRAAVFCNSYKDCMFTFYQYQHTYTMIVHCGTQRILLESQLMAKTAITQNALFWRKLFFALHLQQHKIEKYCRKVITSCNLISNLLGAENLVPQCKYVTVILFNYIDDTLTVLTTTTNLNNFMFYLLMHIFFTFIL